MNRKLFPSATQWLPALLSWLAGLINFALAAGIGYWLVGVSAPFILPQPPVPHLIAHPHPFALSMPAASAPIDTKPIIQAHLFGHPKQQTTPVPSAIVSAPETRLNLTLLGTLHSDQAENAKALISQANANAKEYSIGDAVPGGAQLAEVYPEKVILRRNGQYETLPLKRNPLTKESSIAFSEDPNPTRSAALLAAREQILAKPATISDYIRFYPYQQNGRFIGYRLKPGLNQPQLFNELGLHADDVVTAINGVVLNDALKGLSAIETLATASEVNLQLLRQGKTDFITIPITTY